MKKISLTSMIAMCAIAPAMATPTNTSSTFPNDELMQADYTYTNQATYPNTGVYDGDVTAEAQYDWTLINLEPGYYLPKNSTTPTQCWDGTYCPGATGIHYDSTNNQGSFDCDALGDNSYFMSDGGATSENDCYKDCTLAVANIPHAVVVSGRDYYGTGVDTCVATLCDFGYHVSNGACVANTINITWVGATAAAISANEAGTCTYGGDIRTPQTYDSTAVPTGKHFVGWKFVKGFDLSTITGTNLEDDGTAYGYISNDGTAGTGDYVPTPYGLTENGTWGVTLPDGSTKVRGVAQCSDTNNGKDYQQTGNPGSATTGQYCWCQVTGYQASGESTWQGVTSNPWMFLDDGNNCAVNCSYLCADRLNGSSYSRRLLFGISDD